MTTNWKERGGTTRDGRGSQRDRRRRWGGGVRNALGNFEAIEKGRRARIKGWKGGRGGRRRHRTGFFEIGILHKRTLVGKNEK